MASPRLASLSMSPKPGHFEPVELREQVTSSWEREKSVQIQEDVSELLHDQLPFHFADPRDPRIGEYERRTAGAVYSTDVLRRFASEEYGGIEVEARLSDVTQPVLVLAGRHDRTCSVEAARTIAERVRRESLWCSNPARPHGPR